MQYPNSVPELGRAVGSGVGKEIDGHEDRSRKCNRADGQNVRAKAPIGSILGDVVEPYASRFAFRISGETLTQPFNEAMVRSILGASVGPLIGFCLGGREGGQGNKVGKNKGSEDGKIGEWWGI